MMRVTILTAALPHGARLVELPGLTLLPGFIDAHTHLGSDLREGWQTRSVRWMDVDDALLGARLAPGLLADVVAVAGDPLTDIGVVERVVFVMQGGKIVRGP